MSLQGSGDANTQAKEQQSTEQRQGLLQAPVPCTPEKDFPQARNDQVVVTECITT